MSHTLTHIPSSTTHALQCRTHTHTNTHHLYRHASIRPLSTLLVSLCFCFLFHCSKVDDLCMNSTDQNCTPNTSVPACVWTLFAFSGVGVVSLRGGTQLGCRHTSVRCSESSGPSCRESPARKLPFNQTHMGLTLEHNAMSLWDLSLGSIPNHWHWLFLIRLLKCGSFGEACNVKIIWFVWMKFR